MKTTTNLGLVKPDLDDKFSLEHLNNNWEKIDASIANKIENADGAITKANLSENLQNEIARFFKKSTKSLIKLKDMDRVVNGIHLTIKNNHIHVFGTATSQTSTTITIEEGIAKFEQNESYIISLQNCVNTIYRAMGIYLWGTYSSDQSTYGYIQLINSAKYASAKIDTTEERAISLRFNISAGTYDREFDFMAELGTEMTEFEPYYTIDYPNTSIDFAKLSGATQNIINLKYDTSNVEAGSGNFTYDESINLSDYTFRYQRIGKFVTLTVKVTAGENVAANTLVLSGFPYINNVTGIYLKINSTKGNDRVVQMALNTGQMKVISELTAGEALVFTFTYQISF